MTLIVSLLAVAAFALVFRDAIRRVPWLFYLLTGAMAAAFLPLDSSLLPQQVVLAFTIPMQRCYLAFSLFALVMFIGAFSEDSLVRRRLGPIRAELSIMASLLACAHIVYYVQAYLLRLFSESSRIALNMYGAFALACLLVALLVVLAATSLRAVKSRMAAASWRKLQRLAYPFFVLVCVHAIVALAPSAIGGSAVSMIAVVEYAAVLVFYAIVRLRRARFDARGQAARAALA